MEFIPIEKYVTKKAKGNFIGGQGKKSRKSIDDSDQTVVSERNEIPKQSNKRPKRSNQLKNVKNKYKETLMQKKEKKFLSKKAEKRKETGKNKTAQKTDVDEDDEENEKEISSEQWEENKDNTGSPESSFKKRKVLSSKRENRLFVKLKKKILNEAQIKELHPDIRGVIFPRKKNSRWCWAVFVSEERADEALKQLTQNKDILVTKPNPREMVLYKREEKLKTIQRKKEARMKLKKMWM